jgi:hypothetical protein
MIFARADECYFLDRRADRKLLKFTYCFGLRERLEVGLNAFSSSQDSNVH